MDKGFLIVSVYKDSIAEPISGANVIVRAENYEQSFTTDSSGKTNIIELNAPLKIYSLTPQDEVRPYSIYQLEISKPGFETTIINGVQIFPEETSLQNVFLPTSTLKLKAFSIKTLDIPTHELWKETKEGLENNNNNNDLNTDLRVYPNVVIPEYIIVHNGSPTNSNAENYYVNFIDYIKNVASSEIYSTWPTQSIKANVYAIISFTLNRIYSEWYKSQGYNFTITSLPRYDQAYSHNRTIFKSIADVVDEIFNQYIKITNQNFPLLAQYNDGIKTNNPGWLSQWGSKELADRGYTALQILKYYYTNNLVIESANNIIGLPTSFPGYNLNVGMCSEAIQKVQIMLNTISGNYPKIPKIIPADGQYKQNTKTSIEIFQEVFGIPITGVIDFITWYRISYVYIAVSKMLQGINQ